MFLHHGALTAGKQDVNEMETISINKPKIVSDYSQRMWSGRCRSIDGVLCIWTLYAKVVQASILKTD